MRPRRGGVRAGRSPSVRTGAAPQRGAECYNPPPTRSTVPVT